MLRFVFQERNRGIDSPDGAHWTQQSGPDKTSEDKLRGDVLDFVCHRVTDRLSPVDGPPPLQGLADLEPGVHGDKKQETCNSPVLCML